MANLEIDFCGVNFKNPIAAASAEPTLNAENMKKCPHRWLITYDDSPKIRELFAFAKIVEWQLQYGMNNYKQGKAAKGHELFIKNY